MRRFLLIAMLSLAAILPASAQDWVPKRVAELQALDKVTARVSVFRVTIGEPAKFGSLTISVLSCQARPADEVPDAAVWMEITDDRGDSPATSVFRGWMFASAPGVHTLEHPVYDIRVLDCR
ncbi:hypothetical protein C8P66_13618 [Humitalea rosea]|uniref:DUF2155 domain-containing protein n=1 Tax=Humitalea rosea TaxID=990373 RepID=A0A2W7HVY6_9PROT|nr:DUF2155 domain-containing protein [Humitalea rosea]PZW38664.1 hypothetical protein C8P66_13618 [Humitalea rosea]